MKTLLIAILLTLSSFVSADDLEDLSIRFGGWSMHTASGDFNSSHNMFVVTYDSYFAGYFENSFYDDSFMIGKTFSRRDQYLKLDMHVGINYGYREDTNCYRSDPNPGGDKMVCPQLAFEIVAHQVPLEPGLAVWGLTVWGITLGHEF